MMPVIFRWLGKSALTLDDVNDGLSERAGANSRNDLKEKPFKKLPAGTNTHH